MAVDDARARCMMDVRNAAGYAVALSTAVPRQLPPETPEYLSRLRALNFLAQVASCFSSCGSSVGAATRSRLVFLLSISL